MRAFAIVLLTLAMSGRALAAQHVTIYAAGSLRGAITDIAEAFEQVSGDKVDSRFGPSGQLRDEIVNGAKAEVFASANMEHPQALAALKQGTPVILFTRNRLCALVRPGLAVTSATLLDRMLDPKIKVATSTPLADPSGDYAYEVFRRADKIRPGAQAILEQKVLTLTAGPTSLEPPSDRNVYGWHVAEGRADIFLTYCTNALAAKEENPGQKVVALPSKLVVGADYGLTVLPWATPEAYRFALFILSPEAQSILANYGFTAPTLPR